MHTGVHRAYAGGGEPFPRARPFRDRAAGMRTAEGATAMKIDTKLAQWEAAGLIDAPTRARIAAFEGAQERPAVLYALGGLGALTIAIGTVSIVAANWSAIGKVAKLGGDLAVGTGLGLALYRAAATGREWQTDVLAGIYYGFVLASFALLGQVYQLESPMYRSLALWSLATLPFMTLVRSRVVGATWLAGLLLTHVTCVARLLELLDERFGLGDLFLVNLAASILFVSLAAFFEAAGSRWMRTRRPEVSATWTAILWTLVVVGGFAAGFVFYFDFAASDRITWAIAVLAAVVTWLHVAWPRLHPEAPPPARHGMTAILAWIGFLLAAGTTFQRGELEAVGALFQIVLIALVGWTALQLGRVRTFNACTAAIAIRVLIVYFEVFGSMLDTGLGMISGGVLTLVLAWLWKRKSPDLASRLAAGATR